MVSQAAEAAGNMRVCVAVLFLTAVVRVSSAQAFFTGETGGKGTSSAFVAANISVVRDFTIPGNFWTAYTHGVHKRVDAFIYYGNLTIFGATQHYGGVGSSIGVLQRARHGVDLAFVSFFSTPVNRRDEAATVSASFALSASRPVRTGGYSFTIYSGYLRSEAFGQRTGKLFSPPSATHNGMIGTVLPLSRSLSLIVEYDPGVSQQNVGMALFYVFPGN
jgi:hypothetical protein